MVVVFLAFFCRGFSSRHLVGEASWLLLLSLLCSSLLLPLEDGTSEHGIDMVVLAVLAVLVRLATLAHSVTGWLAGWLAGCTVDGWLGK